MPFLSDLELDVLAAVVHVVLDDVAGPQGLLLKVTPVEFANYVIDELDALGTWIAADRARFDGGAKHVVSSRKYSVPLLYCTGIRSLVEALVQRLQARAEDDSYLKQYAQHYTLWYHLIGDRLSQLDGAVLEMRVRVEAVFAMAELTSHPTYAYGRSKISPLPRATCSPNQLRKRLDATFAAAGISRTTRAPLGIPFQRTTAAILALLFSSAVNLAPSPIPTPATPATTSTSVPVPDCGVSSSVQESPVGPVLHREPPPASPTLRLSLPAPSAGTSTSSAPIQAAHVPSALERRSESALVNTSKERKIPLSPLAQLAFNAEDVQIRTFLFSDEVVSLILAYVRSFNDMSAAAGTSTTWRSVAHTKCPRSWAVVGRVRSRGAAHLAEIFARSENELVSLRLDLDAFYDKSDLQSLTTHLDRVVDLELHAGRSYARLQSWFDTVIRLSKKAMKRLSIHAPQADLGKLHFGTIGSADLQFEVLLAQIPPLSLCSERLAGILGRVARYVALPPYENDLDALARHTAAYLAMTPLRPSSIRLSTPFRDPRPVLVGAHVHEVVLDQSMSSSWQGVYSSFRDTTYKSLELNSKRRVHVSAPGCNLVTSLLAGVPNVTEATCVLWDEGRHVVLRDSSNSKTVSFDRVSASNGQQLWTPALAASVTRLCLSLYLDAFDVYGLLHCGFVPPALEVLDIWIPPRMPWVDGLVSLFAQTACWSGLTSLHTLRLVAASGIDGLPYQPNRFHVERWKVTAFAKRVLGNEGIAVEALGILLMPPLEAK